MRLEHIIEYVSAQVPLAPAPLVARMATWAVDEFMRRTRAWSHTVHDVLIEEGVGWVDLPVPDGTQLVNVYRVVLDGCELAHLAGEGEFLPPKTANKRSTPSFWRLENGRLFLIPLLYGCEKDMLLDAAVCLSVKGRQAELPDWLDLDDISCGAMGKLFNMASQPWTNASMGLYFEDKFDKAIARKRIERLHRGKPGSLSVQAPVFGGYF